MAGIKVRLSVDHAIYTQAHRGFGGVCVWLAVSGRVGVPALAFIRGIGLPGCSCPQGRQGHVDITSGTEEIKEDPTSAVQAEGRPGPAAQFPPPRIKQRFNKSNVFYKSFTL